MAATYHPWAVVRVPFDRQRMVDDVKSVQALRWQPKRTSVTWYPKPEGRHAPASAPELSSLQYSVFSLSLQSPVSSLQPSVPSLSLVS